MKKFATMALILMEIAPAAFGAQAKGNFSLLPRFSAFTLKSTDNGTQDNAVISSKVNMGMEFDWTLSTDTVKLYVFTDFQYAELSQPANKTINEVRHTMVGGGVGAGVYLMEDRQLLVSLVHSYQQNLYFRAPSTNQLNVDKIALPDLQGRVNYIFLKSPQLALNLEVGANMYFSIVTDTQRFRNGYGAFGRVLGNYDLSNTLQFTAGIGALYAKHNTVLIEQSRLEFTVVTGLSMFLD